MPSDQVKIVKKDEVIIDNPKRLREAAKQMVGQADRTNNLFVEVLCDVDVRVGNLETEIEELKQLLMAARESALAV